MPFQNMAGALGQCSWVPRVHRLCLLTVLLRTGVWHTDREGKERER